MQLSELFHPLNFHTIFLFISILSVLDIVGWKVAQLIKIPPIFRVAYWVIGLGLFVSIWFLLHFFIAFNPVFVWTSLIFLGIIAVPSYIQQKGLSSLFVEIKKFPWVIIFALLLAKGFYFMDSMPPNQWDEMAYHYYSPAQVLYENTWQYGSLITTNDLYLFAMTPRFLDTSFVLFFSLTKTYATARLLHTLIFVTSIFLVSRILQKYFGNVAAFIFAVLAVFFNGFLLTGATSGYIDTGTAALVMMSFGSALSFLIERKAGYFRACIIFVAISMGAKYTSLSFVVGMCIAVAVTDVLLQWNNWRAEIKNFFQLKIADRWKIVESLSVEAGVLFLLGIVFGGYWFIKNIVISGNPIYPFFFSCWKGVEHCAEGNGFFASWTIPFTVKNFHTILLAIFQNNDSLVGLGCAALILSLVLAFLTKNRNMKIGSIFLSLAIVVEVWLLHTSAGFELRYFSHWVFLMPVLFVIPLAVFAHFQKNDRKKEVKISTIIVVSGYVISLIYYTFPIALSNAQEFNKIKSFSDNDRWFARGKMSFVDWMHPMMPHMYPLITWCGEKKSAPETLYTADPRLIYGMEGLLKAYLVNCRLEYIKDIWVLPPAEIPAAVNQFISDHPGLKVASAASCEESRRAQTSDPNILNDPFMSRYIVVNTELVCKGKEIQPGVYTYEK